MIDIAITVVLLTGAIVWALMFVAITVFLYTIIFGAKR